MLPQATRKPKLVFGPFEYDPASGELWKHGYTVAGRRGYRFVAPVQSAPASAPVREMPPHPALRIEPNPGTPRAWLPLIVAGGLVLAAISSAAYRLTTQSPAPAIHSLPGFDVSADGSHFVIPVVSSAEGPSIIVIQNWEGLLPPGSPHQRAEKG